MAILYLETHFLLGAATGRFEPQSLFDARPRSLTVAIPRSCIMEAFAANEGVGARRARFSALLDRHIKRLQNEVRLHRTHDVIAHLEEARIGNNMLVDDVRQRLFDVIGRCVSDAVFIDAPDKLLVELCKEPPTTQLTDGLILSTIVSHAEHSLEQPKAFFMENASDFSDDEPRARLRDAGITLISRFDDVLGWVSSLPDDAHDSQ